MNADSIKIECEEDGFWLIVEHDGRQVDPFRFHIEDPEALYDHVKAAIGPWLRERDEARRDSRTQAAYDRLGVRFACDPDESGGYDTSSPKHPDFHSIHADLYDNREGK